VGSLARGVARSVTASPHPTSLVRFVLAGISVSIGAEV
jgi:hypothetical protein